MENLFKKIYMVVVAMFFLSILPVAASASDDDWIHSPKPYDYRNGLLDDPYILKGLKSNLGKEAYDNLLNTRSDSPANREVEFSFDTPINLDAIYMYLGGNNASFKTIRVTQVNGESFELPSFNHDSYEKVSFNNVVNIQLTYSRNYHTVMEVEFFGSYKKDKHPPVKILEVKPSVYIIDVKFDKPDEAQAVDVWLNNQKIERTTKETYTYENLEPDTEYDLMFVNYYGDDNYGAAVRETVRTKKDEVGEVEDLTVKAESHKQVNLNWTNPNQSNFSHVTIYRDEVKKQGILNKLSFFMVAHAAEPTKLFETNGTYFIDHSVAASTSYEYLVTTTDDAGKESVGVSQTVQTLKKPNPDPPTSEMEKDENGDYRVTWTSPTEGKVLIRVGGEDYATVNASQGSFIIPGVDMVYSLFGAPQVQVVAIDLDGDTSKGNSPGPPGSTGDNGDNGGSGGSGIIDNGEVKGIHAKEVLGGTMSFIKVLAPLILLGLIIFLVPRIIRVIKHSLDKNRNRNQRV